MDYERFTQIRRLLADRPCSPLSSGQVLDIDTYIHVRTQYSVDPGQPPRTQKEGIDVHMCNIYIIIK